MTYRLLGVLYDGLPGESLTKTAMRDKIPDEELAELARKPRDGHGPWSRMDLRLAAIEDLLGIMARGLRITSEWQPVARPGVVVKKKIGNAQLAHLRRLAAEHEELYGDTSGRNVIPFPDSGAVEAG